MYTKANETATAALIHSWLTSHHYISIYIFRLKHRHFYLTNGEELIIRRSFPFENKKRRCFPKKKSHGIYRDRLFHFHVFRRKRSVSKYGREDILKSQTDEQTLPAPAVQKG